MNELAAAILVLAELLAACYAGDAVSTEHATIERVLEQLEPRDEWLDEWPEPPDDGPAMCEPGANQEPCSCPDGSVRVVYTSIPEQYGCMSMGTGSDQ